MSHLVSEDLGAGFEHGIKGVASCSGNMGRQCPRWEMGVCNGIFWAIKISDDLHGNFLQRLGLLGDGWMLKSYCDV